MSCPRFVISATGRTHRYHCCAQAGGTGPHVIICQCGGLWPDGTRFVDEPQEPLCKVCFGFPRTRKAAPEVSDSQDDARARIRQEALRSWPLAY